MMLSKAQKYNYKRIAKDLHYDNEYLERIDGCETEEECMRILEYARIKSIGDELRDT